MTSAKPSLFVLVDGADMDLALGRVLGRRPQPLERPRWGRVLEFARKKWPDRDVQGMFFIRRPQLPSNNLNRFTDAMKASGFMVVDPVDVKQMVAEMLRELAKGRDDVILFSHQDYTEELASLVDGRRIVGVAAFPEELIGEHIKDDYEDSGIEIIDFERDVAVFEQPLTARQTHTGEMSAAALLDRLRGNA